MKSLKAKQLIALLLAVLMLAGMVPMVSAEDTDASADAASDELNIENIATIDLTEYTLISYDSYCQKYGLKDEKELAAKRTGKSAKTAGVDYDASVSTGVEVTTWEGRECVICSDISKVTWKIDVPETGAYCVYVDYCAASDKTTDIERVFKINDKGICKESRYQKLFKSWTFDFLDKDEAEEELLDLRSEAYNGNDRFFTRDIIGNENRPSSHIVYEWSRFSVSDPDGYYNTPLEFYFEKGENTITFEGVRDNVAISEVGVYTQKEIQSYDEYLKGWQDKGAKVVSEDAVVKLEGEIPDTVSNYTIYPQYDRTSAITSPQSSQLVYRNEIGGDKWKSNRQWIKYTFEVPETGLYQISVRYLQDYLTGLYTSRAIKIDGEYPFREAMNCQFAYSGAWENIALTNGDYVFAFYIEKGTHVLEFEVNLGNFSDAARQVSYAMEALNKDYMSFLELAGDDPDENRDYGFTRLMPAVIRDMALQSSILYGVVDFIEDVNGCPSETTASLEQAAGVVEKMASDEDEIAKNLSSLKDQITAMGTWLSDISEQYLMMDYIKISPYEAELEAPRENGWQGFCFEIVKFFQSFVTDYNSIGASAIDGEVKSEIVGWTSSGRDQSQIMKNLISSQYTAKTGNNVIVKLVDGNTMLPAILTGTGPDCSLDSSMSIDWAIRGAVEPLDVFDDFDEIMERFADSARITITLYGHTYALPMSQAATVMFVRDDILAGLGLEVPETWDDLLALIPILQFNNMEIGMSNSTTLLLYQRGYTYWRDDEGMTTGIDKHEYLEAFQDICDFYTQYSLPIAYSAQNVFKTGQYPVMIQAYTFYNTLAIFAPEISGLWNFYEIPGTRREDGTVDHSTMSGVTGVWMPHGCKNRDATWEFFKYVTDIDYNVGFNDEMVALLGPSAKQAVANLDALERLPWTEKEYKTIRTALEHTRAVEPYPGDYFIARWEGFAFNAAYNEGKDPIPMLLQYIDSINAELTRKRKEFELMTKEEWDPIKEYMGFETFAEWRDWWWQQHFNDESPDGPDVYTSRSCIQDNQEGENHYTWVNWVSEHKTTPANYEAWKTQTEDGKTELSFKDWLEKK